MSTREQGVCILSNVYQGMEGVTPGEVKWLRINEALPRYWSTGRRWDPSLSSSSWKAALWPRVQWGVVPVEADGSAYFLVPANRSIFFQALDANFREIQRERTYVNYAPGEVRSCSGCHGQASHAVPRPGVGDTPGAAAAHPACRNRSPVIWWKTAEMVWPARSSTIRPTFSRSSMPSASRATGRPNPAGGLVLTGEITTFYNTSYEELASKELAGPIIAEFTSFLTGDRGNYNGAYLPPRSLGCRHEHADRRADRSGPSKERPR